MFLSRGQSVPVLLDAGSELLDETVVDDWIQRVVSVVEIDHPLHIKSSPNDQREIADEKEEEYRRVDLQRLDVHGSLFLGLGL